MELGFDHSHFCWSSCDGVVPCVFSVSTAARKRDPCCIPYCARSTPQSDLITRACCWPATSISVQGSQACVVARQRRNTCRTATTITISPGNTRNHIRSSEAIPIGAWFTHTMPFRSRREEDRHTAPSLYLFIYFGTDLADSPHEDNLPLTQPIW